jgi:hypothetical protein
LKISSIGDYWDNQTVERITEILCEYNELFPKTFLEMKGVVGELGEMNIPSRLDFRPIRQRSYRQRKYRKYKHKAKDKSWNDIHIKKKFFKEGYLVLLYDNKYL